jgi:urease accessory protein UreE
LKGELMELRIKTKVLVTKAGHDVSFTEEEDLIVVSEEDEELVRVKAPAREFRIDPNELSQMMELILGG